VTQETKFHEPTGNWTWFGSKQ